MCIHLDFELIHSRLIYFLGGGNWVNFLFNFSPRHIWPLCVVFKILLDQFEIFLRALFGRNLFIFHPFVWFVSNFVFNFDPLFYDSCVILDLACTIWPFFVDAVHF